MRRFLFAILLLAWAGQVEGATYYVSPTGSPAIGAGENLCADTPNMDDFDGKPVCSNGVYVGAGTAPTIGAYQYGEKGINPPVNMKVVRADGVVK